MRNNYPLVPFLTAGFALVVAWLPALAVDEPGKPTSVQDQKPAVKKRIQAAPVAPGLGHRQRAVTQGDYKPLVKSQPGVNIHRVTQPRPSTGGREKESATPAERRIPSTLRHRDRAVTKKKKFPDDNQ